MECPAPDHECMVETIDAMAAVLFRYGDVESEERTRERFESTLAAARRAAEALLRRRRSAAALAAAAGDPAVVGALAPCDSAFATATLNATRVRVASALAERFFAGSHSRSGAYLDAHDDDGVDGEAPLSLESLRTRYRTFSDGFFSQLGPAAGPRQGALM